MRTADYMSLKEQQGTEFKAFLHGKDIFTLLLTDFVKNVKVEGDWQTACQINCQASFSRTCRYANKQFGRKTSEMVLCNKSSGRSGTSTVLKLQALESQNISWNLSLATGRVIFMVPSSSSAILFKLIWLIGFQYRSNDCLKIKK